MRYLPLCLDMTDRRCVVVGGGPVAERKTMKLLDHGARVRVVSPRITPGLHERVQRGEIEWEGRSYRVKDIVRACLVVAATSDGGVNRKVAMDAKARGLLVNVVDSPSESSCIFPAVLEEEGITVAVSSNGGYPRLSKRIRDRLRGRIAGELRG